MTSETSFRYACYARTTHVTHTYHTSPHVTRNIYVFYEIKKPNKIGGLVNSLPKRDKVFFVTSAAVSFVTRYLHTGVSPITPTVPKGTCLLHTLPPQTGTHNTEPAQSRIEASKSPLLHNTHTQRRKRP